MASYGFFIGRMNPLHLGHEAVINHMIATCGAERSVILIGSANAPTSLRHFFSYSERREFIRTLYPTIHLAGLPDYPTDEEWLRALYDIIEAIAGTNQTGNITFFGGANDDLTWYKQAGHTVTVLDRFNGTTPVVSATEVRDQLIHGGSLEGKLNPQLIQPVQQLFQKRWQAFRQL